MASPRNYYRYTLRERNRITYVGITNDGERREQEHRAEGKHFDRLRVEGPAVTEDTAERWEEQKLADYRSKHRGRNPRDNKTKK